MMDFFFEFWQGIIERVNIFGELIDKFGGKSIRPEFNDCIIESLFIWLDLFLV